MNIKIVSSKYGQMIINADDDYVGKSLQLYGEYCEAETAFLSNLISKESIVCDIGANIGALSIPFAKLAKKVYCFEPHPKLFKILCGNIALNDLDNVECYNIGVGETNGTAYFQDLKEFSHNNGAHSLLDTGDDGHAVHITNSIPACNLVKIDVEGYELNVLKGITSMIKQCNPFLFVENDRREKSDALISYIYNELNYQAYWCAWCLFNEGNFNNNKENIYGDVGCANMICLPKGTYDFTQIGLREATIGTWYSNE